MLTFFIHGVNTANARYADQLIENIRKELAKQNAENSVKFYASFWGNVFNHKKHQITECLEEDFTKIGKKHPEYRDWKADIYRYRRQRTELINNFLSDFLIYQNPKSGKEIRRIILGQFQQFLESYKDCYQIHFVAHSLGSLILWDLLFSNSLSSDDPAFLFREMVSRLELTSFTTMGSPLLFLTQMLNIDLSMTNFNIDRRKNKGSDNSSKLRWVNIIHSSDLIAYPLEASIQNETGSDFLFFDQYIWQCANPIEQTLINLGQLDSAMVVAAEDAHSSYFKANIDGRLTARIIVYNLLDKTDMLLKRCVTPR